MVAIFTGRGTGAERGSGALLGAVGLLGSSRIGRSGQQAMVNGANGNLMITQNDSFLVGRGPDVELNRTYNSSGSKDDRNGDNWNSSGEQYLYIAGSGGSGNVTLYSQDGSAIIYQRSGAGSTTWIATDGSGSYDTITNVNNKWVRVDGNDQTVEEYTASFSKGLLLSKRTDASGNSLSFSYGNGGRIETIASSDGSSIEYTYAGSTVTSNATQIKTTFKDLQTGVMRSEIVRYGYTTSGLLSTVTYDLTPSDGSIADGAIYQLTYEYDVYGSVTSVIETDGSRLDVTYDGSRRVVTMAETIATGAKRGTSISYGSGFLVVTDAAGQTTRLNYDGNGYLTSIVAPPPSGATTSQTTSFTYSAKGDVTSVVDPLGKTTSFAYDASGNQISETDRLGGVIQRTYGSRNQLLTETRTGSDEGAVAAAHTERYVYDSANRLRFTVSAAGDVREQRYDSYGQIILALSYTGQRYPVAGLSASAAPTEAQMSSWVGNLADKTLSQQSTFSYDAKGSLVQQTDYAATDTSGVASSTAGSRQVSYVYDQAGRLLHRTVAGQNTEHFTYDGLGRLISSTDLNGGVTTIVFNDAATKTTVMLANGLVQTSTYNKAGDLISYSEAGEFVPTGSATYQYDAVGRLRTSTDANAVKIHHLYDKVGRRVADVGQAGEVTEYRYDAADRLVTTVRYATAIGSAALAGVADPTSTIEISGVRPASAPGDLWTWQVYDAEGRVVESIDGSGAATVYSYDASDRLVSTTDYGTRLTAAQISSFMAAAPATTVVPTADPTVDRVARTFYDADGLILGTLDGEGHLVTIAYDAAGQKIAETAYAAATAASARAAGTLVQLIASIVSGAGDRTTRYAYDGEGLLRYVVDPSNHVVEYGYASSVPGSSTGQVRRSVAYAGAIAVQSAYTVASIGAALANGGLSASGSNRTVYSVQDGAGRLAYSIAADGSVVRYGYDAMGQVVASTRFAAVRPTTQLPTVADMDAWAGANASVGQDRVERSYYTDRGEPRFVVDAEGYVTRNDYDAGGRLSATLRFANRVAVDASTTVASLDAVVTGSYVATTFAYDAMNRLASSTDANGAVHSYGYYANGLQQFDVVAAGTPDESVTRFEYDGAGRLSARTEGYATSEQITSRSTYNAFGEVVGETDARNQLSTLVYDRRGLVASTTDAGGGVTSFRYNAFGERVVTTDPRGAASYSYYDADGLLVAARDAESYVTVFGYNPFGEVSTTTRRYVRATNAADAGSPPQVPLDARDAITSFGYDRLGRVVTTTDAEGQVETTTFDAFGNAVGVQNRLGGITSYAYDRRGLLLSEHVAAPVYDGLGQLTAGGYYRHVYTYDSRGTVITDVEGQGLPEQRSTSLSYDAAGRLLSRSGSAVSVGLPGQKQSIVPSETYAYDRRGNLLLTVDATGARSQSYYDHLDRMVAQVRSIGDVASAVGALSTFAYDANGNVVTSRSYDDAIPLPQIGGSVSAAAGGYRETTYSYDALDRLTTTTVGGVRTGAWDGTQYATAVGSIVTTNEYDANGNVVRSTDGRGGSVLSYYDKAGRKTSQVDAAGYVTTWTLDAEGNVVVERRSAAPSAGATTAAAPVLAPNDAADRVTDFTYDRNGRRLAETRRGVQFWSVDGVTGALSSGQASATISYAYNGLGEVTRRTEATGEYVDYAYDTAGRLTHEARAPFVDQTGASVRPAVDYAYDGLGDLVRTVESGTRVTSYAYGAGGRLESSTDAAGNTRSYHYDSVGRKVAETYLRANATGSLKAEGTTYAYDAAGQLTRQGYALQTDDGQWIAIGDTTGAHYNAHGEAVTRSVNEVVQERLDYDNAGRVWRSNADDGSWRYYGYDASGNQTYMAESNGQNLHDFTLEQVLGVDPLVTLGTGKVETYYVYDARNQAAATIMPSRQIASGAETLSVSRGYNAFGEVISEVDAAGYLTSYAYNSLGRTLSVTRPQVQVTDEQGATTLASPVERYFFDLGGRLVGTADANGNVVTRALQAGTGYGQTQALVAAEWHPDGGVARNGYDVFGDLRVMTDEVGQLTTMSYDALGRLTQMIRADGYTDGYGYDLLGQRVSHSNSGFVTVETTGYDVQGRVTSTTSFGGDATSVAYVWDPTLTVAGLGTQGGWNEVTYAANGRSAVTSSDAFAHTISRTDLGGHVFSYAYDAAGRLTSVYTGDEETGYIYLNTGLVSTVFVGRGDDYTPGSDLLYTTYTYDKRGYKVSEGATHSTVTQYVDEYGQTQTRSTYERLQGATATYDALGRMTSWRDVVGRQDAPDAPTNGIDWQYDAAGNVRHAAVTFNSIEQDGSFVAGGTQDQWFRYDAMNRIVTDKGTLENGQIVHGFYGTDFTYDATGRRTTAISTVGLDAPELSFGVYQGDRRDTYVYDPGGQLSSVTIEATGYTLDEYGFARSNGVYERPQGGSTFSYDAAGRMTHQVDSDAAGVVYDRSVVYNDKGQATSETISQRQGGDTVTTIVTTDYGAGLSYALGSPVVVTSTSSRNGQGATTSQTTYGYEYFDGPFQSTISFQPDVNQSTVYTTAISYTGQGVLAQAAINDGRARTVTYQADAMGQVLRRDEVDGNAAAGDPHEVWFRFNGRELGHVGNNGTTRTDYATSVADRAQSETTGTSAGAFRHGAYYGLGVAEFGGAQPINSYSQGADGGTYTVRSGDTLASVAQTLWGDASLWYKLAQANGLGADNQLVEGQVLTIPRGVLRSGNSSSTFEPYDPASVLGDITPDTSPTNPQPQARGRKNRCGVFGAILLVAVAVAVTALTYGALTGPSTSVLSAIGAGAALGAAGSVASQGVGLATGIQDRFSFKGVALAAIAGGVGGGLSASGLNGASGFAGVAQDVARGVLGSALTQGVSVVTGLQSKFNFAGVAVGGVVGGVAGAINLPGAGGRIVAGTAAAVAGAAARSLLDGSSFGDNVLAALPDVIGSTIGGLVAKRLMRTEPQLVRTASLRGVGGVSSVLAGVAAGIPYLDGVVASDSVDTQSEIVVVGQRFSPLEAFLYDLNVGRFTSAIFGGFQAVATLVGNPAAFVNTYVRPEGDRISAGLTRGVNAASQAYDRYRSRADAALPRSGVGYYVGQARLAPADFAAGFLGRAGRTVAALPGAITNPGRTLQAAVVGLAGTIDAVALDDRSIARAGADAIARVANNGIRQNATALGAVTADFAAAGLPVAGGVLRTALARTIVQREGAASAFAAERLAIGEGGGSPRFTFRGDNRAPDVIFNEGFAPRGSSTDLLAHAYDNTLPPSAFVSTSKSADIAAGFSDNVYVVRSTNGVDVNRVLGPASPFPDELEVAIPGRVLHGNVRGVTISGQRVSILNPYYRP